MQTAKDKDETLQRLKEEAARARARALDGEKRQARIFENRFASATTDEEGAYRLSARNNAEQGAIFNTIFQRFRDRIARDAKKRGLRLTSGQIGADALTLMAQTALEAADGTPVGAGLPLPEVQMHILIGHESLQAGELQPGEVCEIDGVGPITVQQALTLTSQGAFVSLHETDGPQGSGVGSRRVARVGTLDPSTLTREKVFELLESKGEDVRRIEKHGRCHIPLALRGP